MGDCPISKLILQNFAQLRCCPKKLFLFFQCSSYGQLMFSIIFDCTAKISIQNGFAPGFCSALLFLFCKAYPCHEGYFKKVRSMRHPHFFPSPIFLFFVLPWDFVLSTTTVCLLAAQALKIHIHLCLISNPWQ